MRKSPIVLAALALLLAALALAVPYPRYHREMRAARARLLAQSSILHTPQGELEYSVAGDGPPVLALHGAGGGYDQGLWLGQMALGNGYKFVAVSRYGYLRSPIPAHASIRSQADAYRDLLDQLHIGKVIVIGGSAGGPSATQFANDFPERTSALILISAVGQAAAAGDKPPFYVGIIHLIQQSDYAYWLVAKFMRPTLLNLMGIPPTVYSGFTADQKQRAQQMLDIMHPMSARYAGTINDSVMIQQAPPSTANISAPTLILHARNDTLVSFQHAEHTHASISQSRLVVFETGGHGLLSEMSAVRQSISQFLEQLR
jgi:pimeloyl-ACP methyl ester carboxylesterase